MAQSCHYESEYLWSEEHDLVPLKQCLKMLLASRHRLNLGETKTQHGNGSLLIWAGRILRQEVEVNDCNCSNQRTGTEVNAGILRPEKFGASAPTLQCSVLSKCNVGEKMESAESLVSPGNCLSASSGAASQAVQMKLEAPEDFRDDLDHNVLKERQKMLLSRCSLVYDGITDVCIVAPFSRNLLGFYKPLVQSDQFNAMLNHEEPLCLSCQPWLRRKSRGVFLLVAGSNPAGRTLISWEC
ncbi:hypothetical protein RJ639_039669 [Escallonia herrerae]|uniref:Uncharacterized protein n=1 Tax=Escallonia herrerae TaxID=1293975 RepID=A0AA89B8I2_9ASTE|nr:hypothetical protein RJ639_039669 [Escallonia herrerae]